MQKLCYKLNGLDKSSTQNKEFLVYIRRQNIFRGTKLATIFRYVMYMKIPNNLSKVSVGYLFQSTHPLGIPLKQQCMHTFRYTYYCFETRNAPDRRMWTLLNTTNIFLSISVFRLQILNTSPTLKHFCHKDVVYFTAEEISWQNLLFNSVCCAVSSVYR